MERTELIITLTGVGLAVVLFLFYCVFESCIKFFQDRRNPEDARIQRAGETKDYVQLGQFQNTISFGRRKNPQMKHLLNDPYRSDEHNILVTVIQDDHRWVGMCALLNDGIVEYFIEKLAGKVDSCQTLLSTISFWSSKWQGAESIHLLCQDKELVKDVNVRRIYPYERIRAFEEENNFRISLQWTENFHCRDLDFQDLMESFPVQAQRLLGQDPFESNDSPTRVWSGFLLSHWDLQNVHPELISIDRRIQDQSDDDDDEDENGATGQLVDLS